MHRLPVKVFKRFIRKSLVAGAVAFILSWIVLAGAFKIEAVYGIYQLMESFVYFQIFSSSTDPHPDIIMIDEEGQICGRKTYADLIEGLYQCGARVIAFDVLFKGEKEHSDDIMLAEATKKAASKVIHAIEFLSREQETVIPDRFRLELSEPIERDRFIENVYGASLPYPELLKVTRHLGNITSSTDITRHQAQYFPLLIYYNDHVYPSLPLLVALKYIDYPDSIIIKMLDESVLIKKDSLIFNIPLDNQSQILINFIHPSQFSGKVFSVDKCFELIAENSPIFKDKIILVGNTYESQEHSHAPHFESYPNLFIYAALISQLLNNENINEGILESVGMTFLLVVLSAIIFAVVFRKTGDHKYWLMYLFVLIILLMIGRLASHHGVKLAVVMSFTVFCISFTLSSKVFLNCVNTMKSVFMSFNCHDKAFAMRLKSGLEKHGIKVMDYLNYEELGEGIEDYINQSIYRSNLTLLIISREALRSEWVMLEVLSTLLFGKFAGKIKLLAIILDDTVFDVKFQKELAEIADVRLNELKDMGGDHMASKIERLEKYNNNLQKLLTQINEKIVADFRDEKLYDRELKKLIKQIEKAD